MVKRNVFISFHQADEGSVDIFVSQYAHLFNDVRTLGVSDADTGIHEAVDSEDFEYVMRRIREKYIAGTSCTIVLIGQCTWARRYVDWEIAATLRNQKNDPRGGLIAVQLPAASKNGWKRLPDRVRKNINWDSNDEQSGYARFYEPPKSGTALQNWVDSAVSRRDTSEPASGSTSNLRKRSAPCP